MPLGERDQCHLITKYRNQVSEGLINPYDRGLLDVYLETVTYSN